MKETTGEAEKLTELLVKYLTKKIPGANASQINEYSKLLSDFLVDTSKLSSSRRKKVLDALQRSLDIPVFQPINKPWKHVEVVTTDVMKTKDFYSKLFGWSVEKSRGNVFFAMPKGAHWNLTLPEENVTPKAQVFFVSVDNIPTIEKKAVKLGGKVLKSKKPNRHKTGFWGTIRDPTGNVIRLWSEK